MSIINYTAYYRIFVTRKPSELRKPKMFDLHSFKLPRESTWHNFGDNAPFGPTVNDSIFSSYKGKVFKIFHITKMTNKLLGKPRPNPSFRYVELTKQYTRQNKPFRPAKDMSVPSNGPVPFVVNYSMIYHLNKYLENPMEMMAKHKNIARTAIENLAMALKARPNDNHFFPIELPSFVNSRMLYNKTLDEIPRMFYHNYPNISSLLLLEMYKWLTATHRSKSLFDLIDYKNMDKLNILFIYNNKFININLGTLNQWRNNQNESNNPAKKSGAFVPIRLIYEFLYLICTIIGVPIDIEEGDEEFQDSEIVESIKDKDSIPLNSSVKHSKPERSTDILDSIFNDKDALHNKIQDLSEDNDDYSETIKDEKEILSSNIKDDVLANVTITQKDSLDAFKFNKNYSQVVGSIDFTGELKMLKEIEGLSDEEQIARMSDNPSVVDTIIDGLNEKEDENLSLNKNVIRSNIDLVDLIPEDFTGELNQFVSIDLSDYQPPADSNELLLEKLNEFKINGDILPSQLAPLLTKIDRVKNLKVVDNHKEVPIQELTNIDPEELVLEKNVLKSKFKILPDSNMAISNIKDMDKQYLDVIFKKDIIKMIMGIQSEGVIVSDIETETIDNITGGFVMYAIRLIPFKGKPSNVYIKIPKIDEDGYYVINKVKYRLSKQKSDLPIRKIAANKVLLFSYYGKLFVERCPNIAYNQTSFIVNKLTDMVLEGNELIKNAAFGNVFDSNTETPRFFSGLSQYFKTFTLGNIKFDFDISSLKKVLKDKYLKALTYGQPIGYSLIQDVESILVVNEYNEFFLISKNWEVSPYDFISKLSLDISKLPKEYVRVKILGENVPIVLVLAYKVGFVKLFHLLKVPFRVINKGSRMNLKVTELAIRFSDKTLIIDVSNKTNELIFSGLIPLQKILTNFKLSDFNNKDIFYVVFRHMDLSNRYVVEIDTLYNLFIDPITLEILTSMNEPKNLLGLFVRSCELLKDDKFRDEFDPKGFRIRGYERIAGAIYNELAMAIKAHKNKPYGSNKSIDINPVKVWLNIISDPATIKAEEINPIKELKQKSEVTYGGNGGRNIETMVKKTRKYHKGDMGVISEATVDSAKVGVSTQLTASAELKNLRGMYKELDISQMTSASLLSDIVVNAPFATQDDPKRVGFISIQQSHLIACDGYEVQSVSTGAEQIYPLKSNKLFSQIAEAAGEVTEINDFSIVVKYANDKTVNYEYGSDISTSEGMDVIQKTIPNVKVGQKVNKGDNLAYNPKYFKKDYYTDNLVLLNGVNARIAYISNASTYEDSCVITENFARKLTSNIAYRKTVIVRFDQHLHKLATIGSKLTRQTPLVLIEDNFIHEAGLLDESVVKSLNILQTNSPKPKKEGYLVGIEVLYRGNKKEMSPTLKKLANIYDKALEQKAINLNRKAYTGEVFEDFRIEGKSLERNTVAITFILENNVGIGVGDKLCFGNQMKSIISDVTKNKIYTEDGEEVDIIFSYNSVMDRMVSSMDLIGTTNTCLYTIADKAIKAYNS